MYRYVRVLILCAIPAQVGPALRTTLSWECQLSAVGWKRPKSCRNEGWPLTEHWTFQFYWHHKHGILVYFTWFFYWHQNMTFKYNVFFLVFFLWYQKYLPVGTFLFVSIFFTLARSQLRLKLVCNNQLGATSLSQLFNITENESFVEIIILDWKSTYR